MNVVGTYTSNDHGTKTTVGYDLDEPGTPFYAKVDHGGKGFVEWHAGSVDTLASYVTLTAEARAQLESDAVAYG